MELKINEIILRVLNGESSAEEDLQLINWISESEQNLHAFSYTEKLWNAVDIILNRHRFDQEKAFNEFKAKIRTSRLVKKRQPDTVIFRKLVLTTTRWAAIAVLLLSIGGLIGYLGTRYSGSDTTLHEVVVPTGARSNIKLPDGTNVWLNAESTLRYSQTFNKKNRIVFLTGEGYFEVAENVSKPFVVKTSEIEITALGTVFNVKAYPDESLIQTTLIEGLVVVNRESDINRINRIILEPNQQATYYKKSGEISLQQKPEEKSTEIVKPPEQLAVTSQVNRMVLNKEVDAITFTAWKDNSLIFDNETFKSIAVKLERRFSVNIVFQDPEVMNFRFSGRFDNISIEQALAALKYASPMFAYAIEKDTIYIKGI